VACSHPLLCAGALRADLLDNRDDPEDLYSQKEEHGGLKEPDDDKEDAVDQQRGEIVHDAEDGHDDDERNQGVEEYDEGESHVLKEPVRAEGLDDARPPKRRHRVHQRAKDHGDPEENDVKDHQSRGPWGGGVISEVLLEGHLEAPDYKETKNQDGLRKKTGANSRFLETEEGLLKVVRKAHMMIWIDLLVLQPAYLISMKRR